MSPPARAPPARARLVLTAALAVLLAATAAAAPPPSYDPPAEGPEAELVYPKDEDPVSAIEVARDGTVLFADIDGPVYRLDPGASEAVVVFDPPVVRGPEWGVTGLALAPDFEESGDFFVVYMTGPEGVDPKAEDVEGETRVVKVSGGEEARIHTYTATRFHNSGRIVIHDGLLYLSRGEQNDRSQSQDPANPAGNVLRMTLEGEPAPGNPFGDLTYAYGFRNPFGLAWDEERDRLVLAEVGNTRNEEVNAVEPGKNYGWPKCEGACDPPRDDLEDPLVTYADVITPTGLAVVGLDYYHASFNRGTLHRVYETADGWTSEVVYDHPRGLVVDVERSPDGQWIYFGSWDGLWRIPTPQVSVDTMADAEGPEDRLADAQQAEPPSTGTNSTNSTDSTPPTVDDPTFGQFPDPDPGASDADPGDVDPGDTTSRIVPAPLAVAALAAGAVAAAVLPRAARRR